MAGCGAKAPDYTSVLTATTSAKPTETTTPVPIAQYLESAGIVGQPVPPEKLTDLTVTMPTPKGWSQYSNPRFAPGTRMIAKGDTYPTAMLLVFALSGGDFDVKKALEHANADAELSQNFKQLNASTKDFKGFPSSMIEGSYDLNGKRMHTYNRVVIATGSSPGNQRYLIQFTVTGYADKAQAEAPDIEAIIAGFTVAKK
ncbi:LpqN/LpqT family lipoprotein [Mycobacterium sp. 1274761.0]|uniref:LpqN/LpqT family lipoprotein n=1 Tax=Mycobacterium sp. 1274761.0 TaxID=1834077 RepID=UPI0007FFF8D7|nr:LpqN/LpqT family lipoprotein [Mycobacterium sp. 1274761.0]OBK80086.1 hypothetical protein A5651_01305 [Mycobacterium sp. 1274761.0]